MKYAAIIFDLDGVICHTDQYHFAAWKTIADRLGIAFGREENNLLRGLSRSDSLEVLLQQGPGNELTAEEKEGLLQEKNELYRDVLQQLTPADMAQDTLQTLEELRRQKVLLAIGSSSRNAPLILERLGISGWFDVVVDGNDIARAKPAPEVFCTAAQRLALKPGQCLVVEDADAGVEAARRGGFDVAGIGVAAQNQFATYSISRLSDLLNL